MYSIYRLKDPRDNSVFYVGLTLDVYRRFIEHISCSDETNFKKNRVIWSLRALNLMVIMEVIEQIEDRQEALKREEYWVMEYISQGIDLTNSYLIREIEVSSEENVKSTCIHPRLNAVHETCMLLQEEGVKITSRLIEERTGINRTTSNKLLGILETQGYQFR